MKADPKGYGFNTASGMRSIAISTITNVQATRTRFNTASGMRSIAIGRYLTGRGLIPAFQYRKRYEVYCNLATFMSISILV